MECPVCKNEFDEYTGRKPKKFCTDACKVKFWNAQKQVKELLDDPKVKQAVKESVKNIVEYGQTAVHIPSMTTGISKEDVESKIPKTTEGSEEIQNQIELLIKERDSAPRDYSVVGKKVWRLDRQKKIDELKKSLK